MEYINNIFNIFKTHNIILYILLVCSGVITFDVLGLRYILGVDKLEQLYISIIGLIFLICVSSFVFLIADGVFGGLKNKIVNYFRRKKFKKNIPKLLDGINAKEVIILYIYLLESSSTTWLPVQAPEVTLLVTKGVIYLSSKYGRNMSNGMQIFHYSINPEIEKELLHYLGNYFNDFSEDEIQSFISKNSPPYLRDLNESKEIWNL
ncbi:hypothetical protein B9T31_09605 [Acinetobacter sp. ANC 4558]|uniref:super-infection exclusion protein B n=1 Tax=Acinetobacter sp. ANC 4558 TaxID=1977876 RepID=UPI000A34FB2E|nr:super-infection exclusion protein B [Acinetobacter sp. ANC 4558]OTG85840.1 hypothetical protein B9T31_09605 [Acinetobacter sp. ANC 4558]